MDEPIDEGATAPLPQQEPNSAPAADAGTPVATPTESQIANGPPPAAPMPAYAEPAPPPAHRVWRVPDRWVVIVASVIAGVVLLGAAFGIGVKVGAHASRFDRGFGRAMMQPPYGRDGQNEWQYGPNGKNYRGYGGRGQAFPRAVPSPDTTTQP